MAESPVSVLLRVLAGVGLRQGPVGHQVLGQLLILGSSEAAVAGASVIVAATERQRNAVGQAAIRTAAPAIAASAIIHRDLKRLEQREKDIGDREHLEEDVSDYRRMTRLLRQDNDQLKQEREKLVAEVDRLSDLRLKLSMENEALRGRLDPNTGGPNR